jgi:methionyl-tRNA formyltransferase
VKIVYFGTPDFAAHILTYLLDHGIAVAAVVTQPDRPKGRSAQLAPSAVKTVILEKAPHVPILQPEKASEEPFLAQLAALKADLFVVVVYGQILPQKLLDIPPLGAINVHPSLLPKFRGAAPVHRTLQAGETETGVSIQRIVKQLDAGDVVAVVKTPIPPDMTWGELEKKLNDLSKPLLLQVIREYEKQPPRGHPQDHALATYAHKFEPDELEIHWDKPAPEIHNLIRAFSPRPGAWCWVTIAQSRKRLKILRSRPVDVPPTPPGQLLPNATISCGAGALQLLEVQPEGKKPMSGADWLRGQKSPIF